MPKGIWKNGLKPIPPSRKGIKLSEKHKASLLKAIKGNQWNRGKKLSEQHRSNIQKSLIGKNKGRKYSQWHCECCRKRRLGKRLSIDTRKKLSIALIKYNEPYRLSDSRSTIKKLRSSLEYRLWRERVFKKDKFRCQWCGTKVGKLNADHIKSFSKYPKHRYKLKNGRTLCNKCHLRRTAAQFVIIKSKKYAKRKI